MMLEETARTWLKSLPANSIRSWAELRARFIQNFKDTCKQPMSIVDLAACVQEEGESTTHWVRRVSEILHSSDRINADTAVLTLEGNCRFEPLKLKLGRLKRHCNDMGTLMAALVKYAKSDSTKDPESDDDKTGKGKRAAMPRVSSIIRQAMETAVSARPTTAWNLLLTPMHRAEINGARADSPLGRAGQVPPLRNC